MQIKRTMRMNRVGLAGIGLASVAVWLTGCGLQTSTVAPAILTGSAFQGNVHGGQQPVSGATIQLYAASGSGYGGASYSLLPAGIVTNSSGGFNVTGSYTCPSASSQVYLTATGGNSGSGTNPQLALMAALGPCGSLTSSTFVNMNEVTTVAGVWALAPFMTSYSAVGTSAGNSQGLTNAFSAVNKLVNTGTGGEPGTTLPAGAIAPINTIYTLADILASCINSVGGTAGDNSPCGMLFTAATPPGGTAPADTIMAALDIAKNPSNNVSTLIALSTPSAPFQPTIASATDLTLSIKYTAVGVSSPKAAAVDPSGNLWIANSANNSVAELSTLGAPVTGSPFSGGGLSTPSGLAIDASGNAWIANNGNSSVTVVSSTGVVSQPSVSGLAGPTGVSIDGQGIIWVANGGANSVTAITASGTSATSATTFTGAGISAPVALAINPH